VLCVAGTQARAGRSLALQTPRVAMPGGGRLDLETGALDWSLQSRPLEGLKLATGALLRWVRVRGSLSEPQFAIEGMDWIAGGLQLPASLATAGLHRIAGSRDAHAESGAACAVALRAAPQAWRSVSSVPAAAAGSMRSVDRGGETGVSFRADVGWQFPREAREIQIDHVDVETRQDVRGRLALDQESKGGPHAFERLDRGADQSAQRRPPQRHPMVRPAATDVDGGMEHHRIAAVGLNDRDMHWTMMEHRSRIIPIP
jgi:hypothetical protein